MMPSWITWKGTAAIAVVVALSAGTSLLALTILGVTFRGEETGIAEGTIEGTPQASGGLSFGDPFDYYGRPICVHVVDAGPQTDLTPAQLEDLAKSNVESALAAIADADPSSDETQRNPSPDVDTGCPGTPLPMSCVAPETWPCSEAVYSRAVTNPGGYSTFVFIMPSEQIENLLAGSIHRVTAQEYICGGDVCFDTANALYVTPEEVQAGPQALIGGIKIARGLALPEGIGQ